MDVDLNTLIQVTAVIIKADYETHGTAPYIPSMNIQAQLIQFAEDCDKAWDMVPQRLKDANRMPWDAVILPNLACEFFQQDYEVVDLKLEICCQIVADWDLKESRAYIAHSA